MIYLHVHLICIFQIFLDHHNRKLNVLYKFAWAWQNAFFDAALFITIVYWIALHPGKSIALNVLCIILNIEHRITLIRAKYISAVVKEDLLTTPTAKFLNFLVHGFNSISILIDLFINGRPIRIPHFGFSIVFGLLYMIFRYN